MARGFSPLQTFLLFFTFKSKASKLMLESKLLFHIVLTLHNSRTSQRMRKFAIRPQDIVYLSIEDEILLTQLFKETLRDQDVKCYAYNICKDHVHLIIDCYENHLNEVVRKIKGKTSFLFNRAKSRSGPFWSQKFFVANLDDWQIGSLRVNSFEEKRSYLANAISYIKSNRTKHGLTNSMELSELIQSFTIEDP